MNIILQQIYLQFVGIDQRLHVTAIDETGSPEMGISGWASVDIDMDVGIIVSGEGTVPGVDGGGSGCEEIGVRGSVWSDELLGSVIPIIWGSMVGGHGINLFYVY